MAENKKSVLIYCDLIHTVKHLPDELAGKLFKHFLAYVNDENPQTDDVMLKIAFEPIKQQLKRDLQKYNNIVERNKKNGAKGGRPKNPKEPTGLTGNPKEPKKADTDNDTDTGSDNGKDNVKDTKEKRALKFASSVQVFKEKYDLKMLEEFVMYWTESNEGSNVLRFEMKKNQPFNITRRLVTWKKNDNGFKPNKKTDTHNLETQNYKTTL